MPVSSVNLVPDPTPPACPGARATLNPVSCPPAAIQGFWSHGRVAWLPEDQPGRNNPSEADFTVCGMTHRRSLKKLQDWYWVENLQADPVANLTYLRLDCLRSLRIDPFFGVVFIQI